ncbi:PREDICTED: uncharacterized protein LOC109162442 [Ipomoea nil]|uniref:uncharacterized protein LOC109162442 n=1 Tax=Ipomoea nil TaxID=35883 RepID=UPI0009018866|nr:PREDICTED: uncharacterized protein LOC109162442 [Ipomoea nil]
MRHFGSKHTPHSEVPSLPSSFRVSSNNWTPPQPGFIKCNVDATLFGSGAGYGVVVRNSEGKFVAACIGRLHCADDPYMAKTMAVKEALTWMKTHSFNNIILESDLKQCHKIASDIGNVSVRHVNRLPH